LARLCFHYASEFLDLCFDVKGVHGQFNLGVVSFGDSRVSGWQVGDMHLVNVGGVSPVDELARESDPHCSMVSWESVSEGVVSTSE
jgi:hypothetical protein